jgi:hypothetical protein
MESTVISALARAAPPNRAAQLAGFRAGRNVCLHML